MNIDFSEQEITALVKAVGTKNNRIKQRIRWNQKKIVTLEQHLDENKDDADKIKAAIENAREKIQRLDNYAKQLNEILDRLDRTVETQ